MRQALDKGRPFSARNELNLDGRKVPIEYSATPLKDAHGNIVGGLEYILDITERVKAEKNRGSKAAPSRRSPPRPSACGTGSWCCPWSAWSIPCGPSR